MIQPTIVQPSSKFTQNTDLRDTTDRGNCPGKHVSGCENRDNDGDDLGEGPRGVAGLDMWGAHGAIQPPQGAHLVAAAREPISGRIALADFFVGPVLGTKLVDVRVEATSDGEVLSLFWFVFAACPHADELTRDREEYERLRPLAA